MRRRNDAGAAAVEFALIAPVVILLVFGTLYGAIYCYYSAVATHVARAVARDAAIPDHGVYPSTADEVTVADDVTGTMMPSPTSVTVVPTPAVGEGNAVTVTVTYDLPALVRIGAVFPFLPQPDGVISRTVTVRYE
jgi:Flp pilus assembly protein TadG